MTKTCNAFIQQMPIRFDDHIYRWRLIMIYRIPDSNTNKHYKSLSEVRQILTVVKTGYDNPIVEISLVNGSVIHITDDSSWIEAILTYE